MSRILAIDVGTRRIGVAYSPNNIVSVPMEAVIRKNRDQASRDIKTIIDNYNITTLIVGYPTNIEMRIKIDFFVKLINFNGNIEYIDEDFSSKDAYELADSNNSRKKDGRLDSLSAKIILDRWIEKLSNTY
jgi:putative Holliday junction resolvase